MKLRDWKEAEGRLMYGLVETSWELISWIAKEWGRLNQKEKRRNIVEKRCLDLEFINTSLCSGRSLLFCLC